MLASISIHSPRMGRDIAAEEIQKAVKRFQSTLPAWGETACQPKSGQARGISIHSPRMGRDHRPPGKRGGQRISIHSPRMGRDTDLSGDQRVAYISIHSPRMGRDEPCRTSSTGGGISIHSPRMGRDPFRVDSNGQKRNFNPLSPHGERRIARAMAEQWAGFQSTLPAWGETELV